jgi:hypothetical protein
VKHFDASGGGTTELGRQHSEPGIVHSGFCAPACGGDRPGRFLPVYPSQKGGKLPVVLLPAEVRLIFLKLKGVNHLSVPLMYGPGLRLMEITLNQVRQKSLKGRMAAQQRVGRSWHIETTKR